MMSTPVEYNWLTLPFFKLPAGGGSSHVSPGVDQGWDVVKPRISDARRAAAMEYANGYLSIPSSKVRFFVHEFKEGLSLSGTTGQGRRTRDFYPHNIVMTNYEVLCQCLDQRDYGIVTEFIHQHQQEAVSNGSLIQFNLLDNGLSGGNTMKGKHKPVSAQGFIESVKREHVQFVYAPTFTFSFAVAFSIGGLYTDKKFYESRQQTFLEILEGREKPINTKIGTRGSFSNGEPHG